MTREYLHSQTLATYWLLQHVFLNPRISDLSGFLLRGHDKMIPYILSLFQKGMGNMRLNISCSNILRALTPGIVTYSYQMSGTKSTPVCFRTHQILQLHEPSGFLLSAGDAWSGLPSQLPSSSKHTCSPGGQPPVAGISR